MVIIMEERRRNNRRKLPSKLVVKRLGEAVAGENVEIDITDVSKTGIGFVCDAMLEIGAIYEAFLRIWTQEVIHAFLEIVRIEKQAGGFFYGAIFIGMPEMDAARIEVYDTVESMNEEEQQ